MNLRQRWRQVSLPNKLLIVVGAISASVLAFQVWLSDRSAKEAAEQTDKLIAAGEAMVRNLEQANRQHLKATEDSLSATMKVASDTLAAQREAMRLERRALVGVTGLREIVFEADKPFLLVAEVRNSGATPARITSVRMQTRAFAPSDPFVARYVGPVEAPSVLMIQPGMAVGLPHKGRKNLSGADVKVLREGSLARVHVFGEILYRDIFDRPHFTRFCMRIEADLKTSRWCDTYNEAD